MKDLKQKKHILKNEKISNIHTFISHLFSTEFHKNSKKAVTFNELMSVVPIAIKQEKEIEQLNSKMFNVIGSNIGKFIEELISDKN